MISSNADIINYLQIKLIAYNAVSKSRKAQQYLIDFLGSKESKFMKSYFHPENRADI